mmetsp:Transcript_21734/g.76318  ORF Transcript_21734/g.76318 Transcript_21734/m.76318 type:complete len:314 (+) Transcript_21734:2006-2947(+)
MIGLRSSAPAVDESWCAAAMKRRALSAARRVISLRRRSRKSGSTSSSWRGARRSPMCARNNPMAVIALSLISWSMSRAESFGSIALNSGSTYGRTSMSASTIAPAASRGRNIAATRPTTRSASATVLYQSSATQSTTRWTKASTSSWNALGSHVSSIMRRHRSTSSLSGPCFSRSDIDAMLTMLLTCVAMELPTTCASCFSSNHTAVFVLMDLAPAVRSTLPAAATTESSRLSSEVASAEIWRTNAGGAPETGPSSPTARDVDVSPMTRGPESSRAAVTAVAFTSVVNSVSRSSLTVSSRSLKRSTMVGAHSA